MTAWHASSQASTQPRTEPSPAAFISLFLNALLFFLLSMGEAVNGLLFNAFVVLNIKDAEIKVNLE